MADTATARSYSAAKLSEPARRHLWMHFTRLGGDPRRAGADHRVRRGLLRLRRRRQALPRRALGALLRQRRPRPARARARRRRRSCASSTSTRTGATPTRARSSSPSASPGSRPATSTASSSPPAARRRSSRRSSWRAPTTASPGNPQQDEDDRARDRLPRHDARRARGDRHHASCARRSSRSCPAACHVPNTNSYRWPEDRDPLWAADAIAERIEFEGPETVAAVILEPVQNGGGCIPPQDGYFQRVREICDR